MVYLTPVLLQGTLESWPVGRVELTLGGKGRGGEGRGGEGRGKRRRTLFYGAGSNVEKRR